MTDPKANPLASAEDITDSTGVDGRSDEWAKAVVDGLKADDARSDNTRQSDSQSGGAARADAGKVEGDDGSTLAPVADRQADDDPIGDEIAKTKLGGGKAAGASKEQAEVSESLDEHESPVCAADGSTKDAAPDGDLSGAADIDGPGGSDVPPPPQGPPLAPGSVEDLVSDLERVTGERDNYLESSRRIQAEFENYRKQVGKRETEARERANESLVAELLPVLDACDGAVANGSEDVVPISGSLLDALKKQGLERIDPADAPFDPEFHEAVMHEDGDGDGGPIVAEVMRPGYSWKGRVVRPAMVRVRG